MSILKVEKLSTGYGKKEIVRDISMELSLGQVVSILGPNGCGKSTLIKALCKGLAFKGNVFIDDINTRELSERELAKLCSYVPQRSGLSIDVSVQDAVLMGFQPYLGIFGNPSKDMKARVQETLLQVGLGDYMSANYMELSEGQKRLCILARSLVTQSKLLLMDEPDAALDFGVRNNLLEIISERVRNKTCGVLLTLHDMNLALSNSDYIYLMNNGSFTGVLCPKEDSLEVMERKLSDLYGRVHLLEYQKENGDKDLIMVQDRA